MDLQLRLTLAYGEVYSIINDVVILCEARGLEQLRYEFSLTFAMMATNFLLQYHVAHTTAPARWSILR